jgi:PAT family beta-lactamase induction signal transducer AmpG
MLALAGVAFGDPAHWIAYTALFSVALGVAGATQDITIDGWRITSVPVAKQSVMTAISEVGYRVGPLPPAPARCCSPTDMAGATPILVWQR